MNANDLKTIKGRIPCPRSELDLEITLNGGQTFRWTGCNNSYTGVCHGLVWTLAQDESYLIYSVRGYLTENQDYCKILSDYFRLNLSLEENCRKWSLTDKHFHKSLNRTAGVRILNQDAVETLFSFICSSNNNIQRISSMVEKMCTLFGQKIGIIEGTSYYAFPTIEALSDDSVEATLKNEKFGYRASYIARTAKSLMHLGGREWLLNLKKEYTSYKEAREQLMSLPGIGPKVADCICLMALDHLEAIPIDTHIFQIAKANYLPHLVNIKTVTPKIHEEVKSHLRELWGPLAGWAQAVVFCAKINNNTHSATPTVKRRTTSREKTAKKGLRKG